MNRAWLVWLSCMASCASPPDLSERPLPFHVALAPIGVVERVVTERAHSIDFEPPDTWVQLLERRLQQELDSKAFVHTSRLDSLPVTGRPGEDVEAWLRIARAQTGADLLMTYRLRYGTSIREDRNKFILAAAPFCWIPGPHMWLVPDKVYLADCTLTVDVYDLNKFAESASSSAQTPRRWYFSHSVTMSEMFINYVERVGWNLHLYAAALVVPTLLLPFRRDDLRVTLEARVIEKLAETLAVDLQRRRMDLVRNELDFGFYLDEEHTRIEYESPTSVRVRFRTAHRVGSSRNEPESMAIFAIDRADDRAEDLARQATEEKLSWDDRKNAHVPGSNASGYARFEFETLVEIGSSTSYLELRVTSGRAPSSTRSFALELPPRPSAAE